MKKILLILLIPILLVGCSKVELNLENIKTKLNDMEVESTKVFADCVSFDKDTISSKYGIDTSNMDETLIMMPMLVNNANMYMIVKAKDGKISDVSKELDKIMTSYENAWGMGYAPLEYDKVINRLVTIKGNYLIYIISPDNDEALKLIME